MSARATVALARAPVLLALVALLAVLATMSSLTRLLPEGAWPLWFLLGFALALLPALLARDTPLPAAALVVVPTLAAASYGASRLDWLRVLKDFGVAETSAAHLPRLGLAALALLLLWLLHAVDLPVRMRLRAIERGIAPAQATQAALRSARETVLAACLAFAGAAGLFAVGLVGLQLAPAFPSERAALAAPLAAAGLLVAAALWLARGARSDQR